MLYKGKRLGLNNYQEATKAFSPDITDEVRSAILDGVELGKYLETVQGDSYLLNQIRLALREDVPELYVRLGSGKALHRVRELLRQGVNLEQVQRYARPSTSEGVLLTVLDLCEKGISLDEFNFNTIPEDLLETFKMGILRGIPMRQFNNGSQFTKTYLRSCLVIRSNNQSIDEFLLGDWPEEVLEVVTSHSGSGYYGSCIRHVKPYFTSELVDVLFACSRAGMTSEELARVSKEDEEGNPLFMAFQVERVLQSYIEALKWEELLDPMLGLGELNNMLERQRHEASPRLSVRLRGGHS